MALQFPSPAPPPGLDVTLARQQETGKFDLVFSTSGANKGNPLLDQTRAHAVLSALVSWKRGRRPQSPVDEGGYYCDESGLRGSLIWTVIQDTIATPSQLQAYAQDAGQQLLTLKYLDTFSATAQKTTLARFRVNVKWTVPGSNGTEQVTVNL